MYKNLRRVGKKYNRRGAKNAGRGSIPNRVDISQRPPEVDEKKRVGDWEVDTIIGAQHQRAIVSIADRRTKIAFLHLLSGPKADDTARAIIAKLTPINQFVLTITSDNGKEFSQHERVAENLKAKFFFARPYHSWERGLNENTNGLVRQYFPRGVRTRFSKVKSC